MNLKNILESYLIESGIKIPKDTKAAKVLHHRDFDGVFSAIITVNQLIKQGIPASNIYTYGVQYGDDKNDAWGFKKKFRSSKGQMVALVDFARIPDSVKKPDFWSDHHEFDGDEKPKVAGRVGATEYKSDASHLAFLHTNNMVDGETLKAIDIVDSAGYTDLMEILEMPKRFRAKRRMERLAIICNALLVNSKIVDNEAFMQSFIRDTKPSLVSFYNNILKYARLSRLQKEALEELKNDKPDWEKVEKIRNLMPTQKTKETIKRSGYTPMRDKLTESELSDYEELQELKKKPKPRSPKDEVRYRELVNKPIRELRTKRDEISKAAKDSGKFQSKGSTLIQKDGRLQRYIWTQMNVKGLKHPFVIKRYPTFMQVAIHPDLPKNFKDMIDLNKVSREVLSITQKTFENRMNRWAFEIIKKESGGHKGITNISGLGTLGIMLKQSREELKELEAIKKRISNLKTFGKGKLSEKDKENLEKAVKVLESDKATEAEKKEAKRLKKILMPTMEEMMPDKAKRMQELLDNKEVYANERKYIMDFIEEEFIIAFKKYFKASDEIPIMDGYRLSGGLKDFTIDPPKKRY